MGLLRMAWFRASVVVTACLLAGCAALPKSTVMFQHTPLLSKGTIPLKAGIMTLTDDRPKDEQKALRNVSAVSDQVTAVLLKDFKDANLFQQLQLVSDSKDVDVLLRGSVRSFYWRSSWNFILFVPYVSLVTLFGVPVGKNVGRVAVALDVVDPKTNQVIATYVKASGDERDYSIYQAQEYRAAGGEETGNAFRTVADQLQAAILADRDRITQAALPSQATTASLPTKP